MSGTWYRARAAVDLIHTRSVFVKVHPTPINLSERRAVLHALQRYGTVEVFKRLPSNNTWICAFQRRNELMSMLRHSPRITFKYVSEPLDEVRAKTTPDLKPVSVAAPIEIHFARGREDENLQDPAVSPMHESDPIKTFTVDVSLSEDNYSHKTAIRRNPIHGRWPAARRQDQDFIYYALRQVTPENIPQHGLCDWATGGQCSEDAKLARLEPEVAADWQVADRMERRRNRERLEEDDHELVGWKSLHDAPAPAANTISPAEGSDKKAAGSPTGESGLNSDPETVSEPLTMGDQLLAANMDASQGDFPEGDFPGSDRAPEFDSSRDSDEPMPHSTSKETLRKILDMTASLTKPAHAEDSSGENSPNKKET